MVAVAAVTSALGVVQTWISTTVGQRVMHRLRTDVFTPPAPAVGRLLHPHPHRRGAVPDHQRHRRHAVRGHLDRDVDRLEPHHRRRHRGRDGRAVLAAVAGLAGRAAAGDLPDPPGRPDAPDDHRRSASASSPTSTSPSRRACRSAASSSARRWAPAPRWSTGSPRSSHRLIDLELRSELAGRWRMASMSIIFAAIPAVIYLSAGLPVDRRHDEHRHPGRLHRAAGRPVPAADGPAQRRRLADQLAGAVRPDLRVPGPAGRGRRPGARRSTLDPARCAATCASRTSRFTYPGSDTAAVAGRHPRRAGRHARSRWSARPAPARARSPR